MPMSSGVKLLLILLAIAAAGILAIGAGAWYWWSHHSKDFLESGKAVMLEGQAAGRKLDEAACVAFAVDRHRKDGAGSMGASVRNNLWLTGCLEASRPQPKFCEGVPSYDSAVAVGTWAGLSCAQQGLSDPYCGNLYGGVAKYCSSPARARKLGKEPAR
jgi:hypothetical protein